MKRNKFAVRNPLSWRQKWIVLIVVSLLLGCGAEWLVTNHTRKMTEQSDFGDNVELIPEEYITREEEYYAQDGSLLGDYRCFVIEMPVGYVNKLRFSYTVAEPVGLELEVTIQNGYDMDEIICIEDQLISNGEYSIVNIQEKVKRIEIPVPKWVEIKDFVVLNEVDFNSYRALFYVGIIGLILFTFLFADIISEKIEYAFLGFGLGIGILFILFLPPRGMSWDEHIHMYKSFDLFDTGEIQWSEALEYMYNNPQALENAPFLSREEKAIQIEYLNQADHNITCSYERKGYSPGEFGYLHMAAVIKAAEVFGASFYTTYLLGKLANLLLYLCVMFFAIRILPIGKKALTVMALMPTPMLLATAYSYDALVFAFITLGTALFVKELLKPEKVIRVRTMLLILCCFLLGSVPKIIYLPLVLTLVCLPVTKFRDKKSCYRFRGISLGLCFLGVLILISFVVFGVFSGDIRGGDTSVTGQLELIFNHPVQYVRVLLKDFIRTASDYFFVQDSLAYMAYAGWHKWKSFILAVFVTIVLTEPRVKLDMTQKQALHVYRKVMLPLNLGVTALIWTALYLDFTPVGSTTIQGVQARYYLPMFLSYIVMLFTNKIECRWDNKKYTIVMMMAMLLIWCQILYTKFLLPYCI